MRRGGSFSGAALLATMFGVLCMAVFATLTFVTADRERKLSELDALRAQEFYQADATATKIAAALRAGEFALADALLPESDIVFTEREDGILAEFSIPAGGQQRLEARLMLRNGELEVLQWRKAYAGTWETDDTITLADIAE